MIIYKTNRVHRARPSMFEDRDWKPLLDFPCILGFALEMMHLVDGGVFKDLIENLVVAIQLKFNGSSSEFEKLDPATRLKRSHSSSVIIGVLDRKIEWMNQFKFLEQTRKLR